MASSSPYEVEVTVKSAKDTKNVNWRNGPNRPYAVVWVDPANKCSTRVDEEGDTCPVWDHTLTLPLPSPRVEDHTLYIDVVHANRPGEDTKPLIGSARLKLADVLDDAGFGERATRSIQLKRPSGRPQGKVNVTVAVREIGRYQPRDAYYPSPYGVPPAQPASGSRDYGYAAPCAAPGGGYYGAPAAAPPSGYPYGAPPPPVQTGYGYAQPAPGGYGAAPVGGYGGYGAAPVGSYGGYGAGPAPVVEEKKKSKFGGMGAGLAVGAVAGALGGIALVEGFDALEDKVADDAAEKVEDDFYDGGDDDF